MNLYLVRHGEAIATGGAVVRDADRPLSLRGEEEAVLMGRTLARIGPGLEKVITSPILRAVRTGEIMGNEISSHPVFTVSNHLAPGFRYKNLYDELVAYCGDGDALAVGHQPDLSGFIAYLITGSSSSPASVAMVPGAVALLTVRAGKSRPDAVLEWLLTPQVAKSLILAE
jgi:phosphohistidine phosphatase SixA